eukprot:TRINITY_DN1109_c1_g1_i1.p1 TRINITY_DN1109_c1_g1~~TRINITY_DN1109_c1_g1_i1.p1  ORF type:complete len:449 (-),score=53.97 TRINITY_DN1109_c1_g1_i1:196-1542(-)
MKAEGGFALPLSFASLPSHFPFLVACYAKKGTQPICNALSIVRALFAANTLETTLKHNGHAAKSEATNRTIPHSRSIPSSDEEPLSHHYQLHRVPEGPVPSRLLSRSPRQWINVKQLTPHIPEAKRLIDWLERGVFHALQKKYLATVLFEISATPLQERLLESYAFDIAYDQNDGVMVSLKAGRGSRPSELSMDNIKQATTRMIRRLLLLSETLDPLPKERFLRIKMMYKDDAPATYQPPFFRQLEPQEELSHMEDATSVKIGSVETEYHALNLKMSSTVGIDEDREETKSANEHADDEAKVLRFIKTHGPNVNKRVLYKAFPNVSLSTLQECELRAANESSALEASTLTDGNANEVGLEATVMDLLSKFKSMTMKDFTNEGLKPVAQVREVLNELKRQGVVKRHGKGGFRLSKGSTSLPIRSLGKRAKSDSAPSTHGTSKRRKVNVK